MGPPSPRQARNASPLIRSNLVSSDNVSVTRRIAAPANKIFLIVSNPAGHVEIDSSGMLQTAPDARPLMAVGQTFDMDMDRRPLGDIPNMAEYKVRCTVTQLIPHRLIEWTFRAVGSLPSAMSTSGRSNRSPTANAGQQLLRQDQHQRRTTGEVPLARRAR
jgi:hypothetical protein